VSVHPIRYALGRMVQQARTSRGFTQQNLADLIGTGQSNIAGIETTSRSMPTVQTLLNIAEALGMELKIEFVEKVDG
jgi:transcriptional regulator with XRE-family HTH domain